MGNGCWGGDAHSVECNGPNADRDKVCPLVRQCCHIGLITTGDMGEGTMCGLGLLPRDAVANVSVCARLMFAPMALRWSCTTAKASSLRNCELSSGLRRVCLWDYVRARGMGINWWRGPGQRDRLLISLQGKENRLLSLTD